MADDAPAGELDLRVEWLTRVVSNNYRGVKEDKKRKFLTSEETQEKIFEASEVSIDSHGDGGGRRVVAPCGRGFAGSG